MVVMSQQSERILVAAKVRSILTQELCVRATDLSEDTQFGKDLSLSYMDRMEMVMKVEREFGISLDEVSVSHMETVGDLIDIVNRKLYQN